MKDEFLKRFIPETGKENIFYPVLEKYADWWLDKFLTMLPPEKENENGFFEIDSKRTVYERGEKHGWNDYRRELKAKMDKHE